MKEYLAKQHIDRRAKNSSADEKGRVGYLVLWLLGAPFGLILLLWVIFGNNLIAPG